MLKPLILNIPKWVKLQPSKSLTKSISFKTIRIVTNRLHKFLNNSKLKLFVSKVPQRKSVFKLDKLSKLKLERLPFIKRLSICCNSSFKSGVRIFSSIVIVSADKSKCLKEGRFFIDKSISLVFVVFKFSVLSDESPSMLNFTNSLQS